MSENVKVDQNLSPEEIEKLEQKQRSYLTKEYLAQNKILKLEAEYERLQTEIIESKLRRHLTMLKYSELIASQNNASEKENIKEETLKSKENV